MNVMLLLLLLLFIGLAYTCKMHIARTGPIDDNRKTVPLFQFLRSAQILSSFHHRANDILHFASLHVRLFAFVI